MGFLRWPGSKWTLAQQIINILPDHRIYIEPFLGSGAVFFNKTPSFTEILNDLDGDIFNMFKCLRDQPEELAHMIELTPYSREE